jgi:hypothetical protein
MKRFGISIAAALLACLSLAATSVVEAKNRRKTVTFSEDVLVNDTLVKKGTYEIKFDAASNTVSVLKDGDVIATAKADVKPTERKAPYNSASFTQTERGPALSALTFEGDKRLILVSGARDAGADD